MKEIPLATLAKKCVSALWPSRPEWNAFARTKNTLSRRSQRQFVNVDGRFLSLELPPFKKLAERDEGIWDTHESFHFGDTFLVREEVEAGIRRR